MATQSQHTKGIAVNAYKPGTFCYTELSARDVSKAKAFYGALLGWEMADNKMGSDMVYTRASRNGKGLCGLYAMQKAELEKGVRSHWLSYISVANIKDSVAKAKSAGATVIVDAVEIPGMGAFCIIKDPSDAVVGLWEPKGQIGTELEGVEGVPTWYELVVHDVEKAAEFYTKVFGWQREDKAMDKGKYTLLMDGKNYRAGLMQIQKEWGDVPPNWGVYFFVDNCEAATKKAEKLGAKIHQPAMEIPQVGKMSVIEDPQGALFELMEWAPMPA